jgi:hypothetical protein
VFRSLYVAIVCFVAIALPFFSDFVGLIGALGFWPGGLRQGVRGGRALRALYVAGHEWGAMGFCPGECAACRGQLGPCFACPASLAWTFTAHAPAACPGWQ